MMKSNVPYVNPWSKTLAQMINLRFADKWNHIAEALEIEYDPLENYNRNENTSYQNSQVGDTKDTKSYGQKFGSDGNLTADARETERDIEGSYKDIDDLSIKNDTGKVRTVLEKVSGFDSSTTGDEPGEPSTFQKITDKPVDPTKAVESHTGGIKRTYGADSDPYKEKTKESGSEAFKHEINTGDFGWTLGNVSGNIGVTTSQQMLTQELEVRKNILYDIILRDIADFICLSIY